MKKICKKVIVTVMILMMINSYIIPLKTNIVYAEENPEQDSIISFGQCGENLEWKLNNNGELIISGTGQMDNYESVSEVPWKSYRDSITKIIINNGVESISNWAFYYCKNVTSIEIGDNVNSIGDNAFSNCGSPTKIIIPDSVTKIGKSAFNLPSAELEYLKLSKNIEEIGQYAFQFKKLDKTIYEGTMDEWVNISFHGQQANPIYYSHNLYNTNGEVTKVNLTDTKSIGYAFCNWSNVQSIELAQGTLEIPSEAFRNCNSLQSIVIPNSVTSIGESAFSNCYNLETIELPENITIINSHTFYNCIGLKSITIPNSVIEIGKYAFYYCTLLKDVNFNNNNLNTIGEYAFAYSGIENITLPNCLSVGNDVFRHCENLKDVILPKNLKKISRNMFTDSGLNYFVVPNTITEIEDYAFSDCTKLEFIAIAPSVEKIGDDSFSGCGKYEDHGNGVTQYINKSFIIKGEKGSYAETYAEKYYWRYTFEEHYYCLKSTTNSTCQTHGKKEFECLFCKNINYEELELAEHNWSDEYTIDRESTCAERGEKSIHCLVCDTIKENSKVELGLKEHEWDEGIIIQEPTNTEKGIKEYHCINCDASKTEDIDVLKYSISGKITSYLNENEKIKLRLINKNNPNIFYEREIIGNIVNYSVNEILAGTYKLIIEKENHISKEYDVLIENKNIIKDLEILPRADVNGDGKVNGKDWNRLYEHINETNLLTEDELKYADVNGDGKVNGKDWNRLYEHISEINPLW